MILSARQRRFVRAHVEQKYPGVEIIGIKSVKRGYTDTKMKITLLEDGKESIHFTDLVYIKDDKGKAIV